MDFHSLTRKELQSLCKLNKIPANITNVAMAEALQNLQTVEGIKEFLNVSQSETDGLVESREKVEVSSSKVPQTRCRSTRPKVKIGEAENLLPTATRTTRGGSKQLAGDVEESKNNMLKTPALSSTRRKALATSSCRNVNNRLNECEEEVKKENTVQKAYSTRRSTRLTEKKSAEPRVKKESEKAVKMNSFVDEMDVASKEESLDEADVTSKEVVKLVEVSEKTMESGKPNAELEDICNAFEKLDVLIEESDHSSVVEKAVDIETTHRTSEDCGELDSLKPESDEIPIPNEDGDLEGKLKIDLDEKVSSEEAKNNEVFDQKTESDGNSNSCENDVLEENLDLGEKFDASEVTCKEISSPCENDVSEEKLELVEEKFDAGEVTSKEISGDNLSVVKDHDLVMATEEDSDSLMDNNGSLESGAEEIDVDAIPFDTENLSGPQELEQEHMFSAVSEMKDQVLESNGSSSMVTNMVLSNTENQNEAMEPDKFSLADMVLSNTEDQNEAMESDKFSVADEITTNDMEQVSENIVDETFDVIPTIDNISTMTAEVQDHKPEIFTERHVPKNLTDGFECPVAVDETFDVIPTINNISTMTAEVQDLKPEIFTERHVPKNLTDGFECPVAVDETFDVIPTIDNISTMTAEVQDLKPEIFTESHVPKNLADGFECPVEEKTEFCDFPIKKTVTKTPISFKYTSIVSDDKENIESGRKMQNVFVDGGKNSKKEKDENDKFKSLHEMSMRELRKQVKALTLKNKNANEDAASKEATTRPALQVLCENQLVGGETQK